MAEAVKLSYTPSSLKCSCCGQVKPVTAFYLQSYTGQPSGQCKECTSIKRRVQRQKKRINKFVAKERQRSCGEEIDYELVDYEAAMLHFGGRCCYCGAKEGRSKDSRFDKEHFVPLSRGGKTVRHNIGPSCRKCNRGRGNTKLFEWYVAQPFYSRERARKIIEWVGLETARKEGLGERKST